MSRKKKGWDLIDGSKNEDATKAKAEQEAKAKELAEENLKREESAKKEAKRVEKQRELDRKRQQEESDRKEREAKERRAKKEKERAKRQRKIDRKRQEDESNRKEREAKEKQLREAKAKKHKEEIRLKEETEEKKRLLGLEAKKQQEEKARKEERRRLESQSDTNGTKITGGQSFENQDDSKKKDKKRRFIFFFILLGLGLLYLISCKVFGYCLKTPISQTELDNYAEEIVIPSSKYDTQQEENKSATKSTGKNQSNYQYDSDNDGIIDTNDECKSTPQNKVVLTTGCELDENNLLLVSDQREFEIGDYIYIIGRQINKPYTLDMGDGTIYTNELPKKYKYNLPGSYKIKVSQRQRKLQISIKVVEPVSTPDLTESILETPATNKKTTESNIKTFVWYADHDLDGKGDPNDKMQTNSSTPLSEYWSSNAEDDCPDRKGAIGGNGCPEINISMPQNSLLINQKAELTANLEDPKTGDKYIWTSKAELESKTSKSTFVSYPYVEKIKVDLSIENATNNFQISDTKTLHFKITEQQLVNYLVQLAEFGNYAIQGRTSVIEKDKRTAEIFFDNSLLSENIKLRKTNRGIVVNKNSFKNFKLELLTPKRSIDTKIDITNLKVSNIEYDSTSGKISTFKYTYK